MADTETSNGTANFANEANKASGSSNTNSNRSTPNNVLGYLKSIDDNLNALLKSSGRISQTNAKRGFGSNTSFRDIALGNRGSGSGNRDGFGNSVKGALGSFTDELEKSLLDGLGGSLLKDRMQKTFGKLADSIGMDVKDIPGAFGREVGKQLIQKSGLAKKLSEVANGGINSLFDKFDSAIEREFGKGTNSNKGESANQSQSNAQANADKAKAQYDQADEKAKAAKEKALSEFTTNGKSTSKSGNVVDDIKDQALGNVKDKALDFGKDKLKSLGGDVLNKVGGKVGGKAGGFLQSVGGKLFGGISGKAGAAAASGAATSGAASTAAASGAAASTTAAGTAAAGSAAGAAGAAGAGAAAGGSALAGVAGTFASGLAAVCPYLLIIVAALAILAPAIQAVTEYFDELKKISNRYMESMKKNLEFAQDRRKSDFETMIREPFEILKNAAEELYDAWDSNIRVINGTQGYSKDDLQNLLGNFATRLRNEGLTKVISTADITSSLADVLKSGLSGKVAEEFAYTAAKLNAAVPTQDFFGYADTYASLAANAIKNGKSEAEAISYANTQLELFASNVLYASRQLTGGFSTGLKDASSLFESAVKIAQTSKTGDAAYIGSILTSVAGVTGAIAPDLATALTDAVVQAAIGGNSDQVVALRSMAGINASNTDFLRALASDPQGVFSAMFEGLGNLQNINGDAFMERAEALASVFGISMDAFARVDFNYLADQIKRMNVSDKALSENMALLASGETTTTAEQLKMQQINKYMLEEGLSYVLDNAAARSIQEHMWNEQIARELQESTYAVELTGSTEDLLMKLTEWVQNIVNFLNPFAFFRKLADLIGTAAEAKGMEEDIKQLLELGKVGSGNAEAMRALTTYNQDLGIGKKNNLVNLMGGTSRYWLASAGREFASNVFNALAYSSVTGALSTTYFAGKALVEGATKLSNGISRISNILDGEKQLSSQYTWGNVSKSYAGAISRTRLFKASNLQSPLALSATVAAQEKVNKKLDNLLSESVMKEYNTPEKKGYEGWRAHAVSQYQNESQYKAALEKAGYTESQVEAQFTNMQAKEASQQEAERKEAERQFWEDVIAKDDLIIAQLQISNDILLNKLHKWMTDFMSAWNEYYIKHSIYDTFYTKYSASDVAKIKASENKGAEAAVYALATALTTTAKDLTDPTMQTNTLLSQILLVVNAIMQQNNTVSGGLSLPDALSALSLGLTTPTP